MAAPARVGSVRRPGPAVSERARSREIDWRRSGGHSMHVRINNPRINVNGDEREARRLLLDGKGMYEVIHGDLRRTVQRPAKESNSSPIKAVAVSAVMG